MLSYVTNKIERERERERERGPEAISMFEPPLFTDEFFSFSLGKHG
jgi:hypothetical protein